MPRMVMQMPGRHVSLSQPFLMDQIIQTPFSTIAPLCGSYIWTPKEHFCSQIQTLVGYFMKHATMWRVLFRNRVAWSQLQPQKHNSCLFMPNHSDPGEALYAPASHLRASDLHHKTDSSQGDAIRWPNKAHSVADRVYPHISQVKDTVKTRRRPNLIGWVCVLSLLDLRELVWI